MSFLFVVGLCGRLCLKFVKVGLKGNQGGGYKRRRGRNRADECHAPKEKRVTG